MTRNENVPPIEAYGDPFETLEKCGGVYRCPKDPSGKRLGPLVGLGGTYKDLDGQHLRYVGEIYYYFAMVIQHPYILDHWAQLIVNSINLGNDCIRKAIDADVYLGIPFGGNFFAQSLVRSIQLTRHCYPIAAQAEKIIVKPATSFSGAEYALEIKKYQILPGNKVVIVEDIGKSYATSLYASEQIEARGAEVIAIIGICAGSRMRTLKLKSGREVPIITRAWKEIPQFKQDDPKMAEDVKKGNVIWEPESRWGELMAFMPQPKK